MTHRGPFHPLPFCDSVKVVPRITGGEKTLHNPIQFSLSFYKSSLVLCSSQNSGVRGIQLQHRF